QRRLWR
ncbi:putative drug transport transmembrane domain protein, partial [Vibrio parahaemolyticus V-223/04]